MKFLFRKNFILAILWILPACVNDANGNLAEKPLDDKFNQYWYQNKAEVTSYTLEQARYGELHTGHVVMIFVTEELSDADHLKKNEAEPATKILKLNLDKKFTTGIYPYSMMQSVFTPISQNEGSHTLRVTTSSQEWCGQTFTMLDLDKGHYAYLQHSYFPSEGDQQFNLKTALLEDEIWNLIRLNPNALPIGEIDMISSLLAARLSHCQPAPEKASAKLASNQENPETLRYT